jgi:hypothetical protein
VTKGILEEYILLFQIKEEWDCVVLLSVRVRGRTQPMLGSVHLWN